MDDKVAIVIVNYRTPELTLACVAALDAERSTMPDLRVMVVDGGSGDGSAEKLADGLSRCPWVELVACSFNGGFGWGNNQAMLRLMQRPDPPAYIHLLNPDTRIMPGAVSSLRETLRQHPECAAVGSQLLDDDSNPIGSAFRFPSPAREFFRGAQMNRVGKAFGLPDGILRPTGPAVVDWVTGASVMLRTEALRQVGLFDSGFFLYFEEVELMHRLTRGGWQVRSAPESRVHHIGGAATGMAEGELHERSSIPNYMFASRRRFFTRVYGAAGARRATRAWLAGNRLLRVVKSVGILKARPSADAERKGMLSHGIAPSMFDQTPAVALWDTPPNIFPAWHDAQ